MPTVFFRASFLPLAALALAAAASADVDFSTGFDAPDYTAGSPVVGQAGWVAGTGSALEGVVSTDRSLSGGQSLRIDSLDANRYSSGVGFASGPPAQNRYLTAYADIFVESAEPGRYFGIGFGINPNPNVVTPREGNARIVIALDGQGLRGGTGLFESYNSETGGLFQARAASDFVGRWINVRIVADRSRTTDNVAFTFSGLGTSGGTSTTTFVRSQDFGTGSFGHGQVVSSIVGNSKGDDGVAYIDNLRFNAGAAPVPEPASLAALGLGALAVVRRRRKA